MTTVDMSDPRSVGRALKAEVTKLAADYKAIEADLDSWSRATPEQWQALHASLDLCDRLERQGHALKLKGCPFGASGCPSAGLWACRQCLAARGGPTLPQNVTARPARGIGDPRLACPGGKGHLAKWRDAKGNEWCFACSGLERQGGMTGERHG